MNGRTVDDKSALYIEWGGAQLKQRKVFHTVRPTIEKEKNTKQTTIFFFRFASLMKRFAPEQ